MPPETEVAEAPETDLSLESSNGNAAPETGTSGDADTEATETTDAGESSYEAPFTLADVPDEMRSHVQKYVDQVRSDYDRKMGTIGENRRDLAAKSDLFERLENEDTVEVAFNDLAELYGMEPMSNEEPLDSQEHETEDAGEEKSELETEVAELRERDNERTRDRQKQLVRDHVTAGLGAYAKSIDVAADDINPAVASAITLMAMSSPVRHDGLPDMEGAVEAWDSAEKASIERYVVSKRAQTPEVTGGSGVTDMDMSDPKQRIAAMEAIAARHLG